MPGLLVFSTTRRCVMTQPASSKEFFDLVSALSEEDKERLLKLGVFLMNGPRKMKAHVKKMVTSASEAPSASEARVRIDAMFKYLESA